MTITLVDKMTQNPGCCLLCSGVPCDLEGNPLPMVDTELDVNWGDNLYICQECARTIAGLHGWQTDEEHIRQLAEAREKEKEARKNLKAVTKKWEKEKARNKIIDKGKRALKEKSAA